MGRSIQKIQKNTIYTKDTKEYNLYKRVQSTKETKDTRVKQGHRGPRTSSLYFQSSWADDEWLLKLRIKHRRTHERRRTDRYRQTNTASFTPRLPCEFSACRSHRVRRTESGKGKRFFCLAEHEFSVNRNPNWRETAIGDSETRSVRFAIRREPRRFAIRWKPHQFAIKEQYNAYP